MNVRYPSLVVMALVAIPLSARAADLTAALTGKHLDVTSAEGAKIGEIDLETAGVAHHVGPGGKQADGHWGLQNDSICVQIPPRRLQCWTSARDLVANGHAVMTNRAGEKMTVTTQ